MSSSNIVKGRARRLLRRPGHGAVVAYLALFLALTTGGAWAAAQIGADDIQKNAVRSRHIKNGQVTTKDVRNQAVTSAKVRDGSLGGVDLTDGSVGGADLTDGSVGGADLTDGAVGDTKLAANAVTGAKVLDNSLTGSDVNESTLGQVPDAARLAGRPASAFIARSIYKRETAIGPGTTLGDGTSVLAEACDPGDVLLSGGPANISANSDLLESFPSPGTTNSWSARINKNGAADNFSVVVLCANQ
jgi:hypothetical protein